MMSDSDSNILRLETFKIVIVNALNPILPRLLSEGPNNLDLLVRSYSLITL